MTMGKRQLILFMLSVAVLSFQKAVAQEDLPPLDKTIELLRPKITKSIVVNQQMSGKKSSKQQVTEWTLNNPSRCVLVWKGWKPEEKVGRGAAMLVSVEINLADFDPQGIKTGRSTFGDGTSTSTFWTVFLNTTDNKNVINWRSSKESFNSHFISFRFNDEDLVDGAVKAFQHAVKLCGGKSSPDKPDPFFRKKKKPSPPRL